MKLPILYRMGTWLQKSSGLSNPADWLTDMFGRPPTATGVTVNEKTALYSSAVFACIRVISESIASLPLPLYRRLPKGKERATDNVLYYLLHDQPNPEMTSFTFRETLSSHLLLWGNAYAYIERDNLYRIKGLWPMLPNQTWPERDQVTKEIVYKTTITGGQTKTLRAWEVLHIPGMGFDGLVGYSPIRMAREAIGLSLATEEFGARFFGQGTHLGGIVEYDGRLSDEAFERYKKSVNEVHQGLGKTHKLMFLEQGAKYHQITIPPDDAQFLETRKFQLNEIARLYRVPPHMIGDLEKATFSNIEQQSLEFVIHTLRPWLVRWEQAITWKLLKPEDRRQFFAEFVIDGLLRGDIKSRYEAYAIARQNGWMNADDICELENQNPLPDGQGSVYLVNGNMIPIGQAGQQTAAEQQARKLVDLLYRNEGGLEGKVRAAWNSPQPGGFPETRAANIRRGITDSYKVIFADAVTRILKREEADIIRQAKKSALARAMDPFGLWLNDFYSEHEEYIRKIITPVFTAYARAMQAAAAEEVGGRAGLTEDLKQFMQEYQNKFIWRHIGASITELRETLDKAAAEGREQVEALQERFGQWRETRPQETAQEEAIRAGGAIVLFTWAANGIHKVRWVATGKSCPLCRSLHGKIVDINTPFIVRGKKLHPPAHKGCDCHLAPDQGSNIGGGSGEKPIRNSENFRKEIAEGKIPLKIRKQKQLEHTLDSVKYQEYVERLKKAGWKPSILTADAQEMVDMYAGISDLKWIRGNDYPREYFTHTETVGRYWDKDIKDYVDTSRAVIVYSNKGTHVFPVR